MKPELDIELLQKAIHVVNSAGLAPLKRAYNRKPKDPMNFYFQRWAENAAKIEVETVAELKKRGVELDITPERTVVRFAGITTKSRMGLERALKGWQKTAKVILQAKRQKRPHSAEHVFTGNTRPSLRRSEQRQAGETV